MPAAKLPPVAPVVAGGAPPARVAPDKTAKATAQAFEAVFLGQMTAMMLETGQAEGTAPGGHGEEMFRGVMAEKLGTEIARRGGIGLAPAVMQQIIRMQGGSDNGQ